jgi:hypothetical protein
VRIEDRVDGIDRRLDGIDATLRITTAEVKGLMQMPGIYGAEYGKIRTALEGHDGRFDRLEELISDQGQTLREHRHLLEQILAKVA